MAVSLTHIAEPIFAAIVNRIREPFLDLCGLREQADLDFVRSVPELATCEAKLEPLGSRSFDGASRVDVLVRLRKGHAVAFELKLGTTRLSRSRIDEEWLRTCVPTHDNQRWGGNMMAILDRRFSESVPDELFATIETGKGRSRERLLLSRFWFVVTRDEILSQWHTSSPSFSEFVRYCSFEDVVNRFGSQAEFNSLVHEMLNFDYHSVWKLDSGDNAHKRPLARR